MPKKAPIFDFMTKTKNTAVNWNNNDDIFPSIINVLDSRQEGNWLYLEIGDVYQKLRKDDMLFSPRTGQHFLVMQTPNEPTIKVMNFVPRVYAFTHEVAREFGVSSNTIIRWCREGHIPAKKIKNEWQIDIIMTQDQPLDPIIGDQLILVCPAKAY